MPSTKIEDKYWEEFKKWCKAKYTMWSPNRASIELYLEWVQQNSETSQNK